MKLLLTLAPVLMVIALALTNPARSEPVQEVGKYQPNWKSIDSRPLPQWFDQGKVGIFIHFGVYSVPSFVSEWFWCYWQCPDRKQQRVEEFMKKNYPPGFTYQDFAKDLTLEFFNATEWAKIFEASGAKYAVITSKHHEGYTLYPSKYSFSWNSMDVGPKRDIVGEFGQAIRDHTKLRFGIYHSLFEWFNPLYLQDARNNFTTRLYPKVKGTAELYELVNNYHPEVIWSDGDAGPAEYWDSLGFLAWLYNTSPVKDSVVVNDRWGTGTSCKHGGYLNCADRYNPGQKQGRKWENAMTLDKQSWGYRRHAQLADYLTPEQLLLTLAQTVANGGNLLVDVGPTKEGTIPLIMQERLFQMGRFLATNGEAIYNTSPWVRYNDTMTKDVYYTAKANNVYAIFFNWPQNDVLTLGFPKASDFTAAHLLGFKSGLKKFLYKNSLAIKLPSLSTVQHLRYAWVVRLSKKSGLDL